MVVGGRTERRNEIKNRERDQGGMDEERKEGRNQERKEVKN